MHLAQSVGGEGTTIRGRGTKGLERSLANNFWLTHPIPSQEGMVSLLLQKIFLYGHSHHCSRLSSSIPPLLGLGVNHPHKLLSEE